MAGALTAGRPLLALETLQVANARRIRGAIRGIIAAVQGVEEALRKVARAAVDFVKQVAAVFRVPVELLTPQTGAPYYWRDGKRRRNHAWFRERARIRRRIEKAARRR